MLNLLELVSLKGLVSESASHEIILSHIPSDLQIRLITTALMRFKNSANVTDNQSRSLHGEKQTNTEALAFTLYLSNVSEQPADALV